MMTNKKVEADAEAGDIKRFHKFFIRWMKKLENSEVD